MNEMGNPCTCIKIVLSTLRSCRGVQTLKVITEDEKKRILQVEKEAEEEIAYAMCKTLNIGIREAIKRESTLAILIDSSLYEYPHHPDMVMLCDNIVLGEQVNDPILIKELRNDKSIFFLWDNFVIYTSRLPKDKKTRERVRMVYKSMNVQQLENIACVKEEVFGSPSMKGDMLIRRMLSYGEVSPMIGTCLIGFDIRHQLT
jgi:hypothetical protein